MFVLGRPGNDLLSRVLRHSTIGAEEFNGRVRDGIGFLAPRSNHRTGEGQRQGRQRRRPELFTFRPKGLSRPTRQPAGIARSRKADRPPAPCAGSFFSTNVHTDMNHESNQANRAISTSQLNASPRLHTWPINVVVFHGSDREHSFRGGFPA